MIMNSTLWINMFTQKGGVSTPVTSITILKGVKFDYNKDCRRKFGRYAQVDQDNTTTNNQVSRTIKAIFYNH